MAEELLLRQETRGLELDARLLSCSVCLELLKEPVTIQCGHTYCKSCIESCWDQETKKGKYSCPQCRDCFTSRPVLRRNNVLAEVVKKLQQSTEQASTSAAPTCAGPTDVACDFCCGFLANKATLSCLTCLASYCPSHVKPHYTVPVLYAHQLVSATVPLQKKMCTKHNKLMEIYCCSDMTCICYLCTIDEHRGHRTVSAAAQRAQDQKHLDFLLFHNKISLRERETELNELVQALKDFKSGTQTAVKTFDTIVDEVISCIKKKSSMLERMIEAQERTAVAQAEELQLKLESEVINLKRRAADLQLLSHMDDHIHFIQTYQSLSTSCESPDLPHGAVVRPQRSIKTVIDSMSELREKVERLIKDECPRIAATLSTVDVILPPVPKTRDEFLRYSCPLTLDKNSVYRYLSLSEEDRRVCCEMRYQYYPAHPDRFIDVEQVLCKEGLSQRCYWEVTSNGPSWSVAVSYRDISRTSDESEFGKNHQSWSLACSSSGYTFQHNRASRTVSGPLSKSIGVYLDYRGGDLSFYSLSDKMTLLHKEHTWFTQPLYPGFKLKAARSWGSNGYYAEVVKLW